LAQLILSFALTDKRHEESDASPMRMIRFLPGADPVEQLPDQAERVDLIVPAGKLSSSDRKSANHDAPCRT
jgi:hypothetical protein